MSSADQFRLIQRDFLLNRWRITDEQVNAWRRLDQICPSALATDCVINVGAFLNILDRQTATTISRELNVLQQGVDVAPTFGNQITEQILRSERIRTFHEMRYFNFDVDLFQELFRTIGPGHATVLELRYTPRPDRPNIGGHLVVLAILANGEPILLDPQHQTYLVGDAIREYINNVGYTHFGLYLRNRRFKRPPKETNLQIRRQHHEGPPLKMQRVGHTPERDVSRAPSVFDDELFSSSTNFSMGAEEVPDRRQTRRRAANNRRRRTVRLVPPPEEGEITEEPVYAEGSPAFQPEVEPSAEAAETDSPVYDPNAGAEVPTTPPRSPSPSSRRRSSRKKKKGGKRRSSHKK